MSAASRKTNVTAPPRRAFAAEPLPVVVSATWEGGDWSPFEIGRSEDFTLSPLARVMHYGQAVFEGLKANRTDEGPTLFRPYDHLARMGRSAERMGMPAPPVDGAVSAIAEAVASLGGEIPPAPGALYVRPLLFCDDSGLVPSSGTRFRFVVFFVPMAPLFGSGAGVRLTTCPEFTRAAPGGTGAAKCAGNYAGAMAAKVRVQEAGFDEVLWLDAVERRWIEETGSMNVMLVRDGVLVTPRLTDTILPGITRDTLLWLAEEIGIEAREESIAIDGDWSGVTEVFSSGTAAGTARIAHVEHAGDVLFRSDADGPVRTALSEAYAALITRRRPAPERWRVVCNSDASRPARTA